MQNAQTSFVGQVLAAPPGDRALKRTAFQADDLVEIEQDAGIELARFAEEFPVAAGEIIRAFGCIARGQADAATSEAGADIEPVADQPRRRGTTRIGGEGGGRILRRGSGFAGTGARLRPGVALRAGGRCLS
ncbi:hypothetical protein [Sphingomonas mollis]|uniref:hypothetical protein n=1 Tax=Sphingomonas mollis TaxID=2795726 RepID=UPI001E523AEE|nr:hypothetical protein [Sphingomonas sp. BT553]